MRPPPPYARILLRVWPMSSISFGHMLTARRLVGGPAGRVVRGGLETAARWVRKGCLRGPGRTRLLSHRDLFNGAAFGHSPRLGASAPKESKSSRPGFRRTQASLAEGQEAGSGALVSGCGLDAVVNPERAVNQRIREFWHGSLGCGRHLDGCLRAPDSRTRTGEFHPSSLRSPNPLRTARYGKAPVALASGALR